MKLTWVQRVSVWPQYLLPKHALTHLAWWVSNVQWRPFKQGFIRLFCWLFPVDLNEAASTEIEDYPHFNAFFTRALKSDARPLAEATVISPADGRVSELGHLEGPEQNQLIQAKGLRDSLSALVGRTELLDIYQGGQWATVYLAPYNYHRVHMPISGTLVRETRIAGDLFSVSKRTTQRIPHLYARNERLVAEFEGPEGPFMVILVAAFLVAGIETVWGGPEQRRALEHPKAPLQFSHAPQPVHLVQGDELGRFHWGSTVIVVTPPSYPRWRADVQPDSPIVMGTALT